MKQPFSSLYNHADLLQAIRDELQSARTRLAMVKVETKDVPSGEIISGVIGHIAASLDLVSALDDMTLGENSSPQWAPPP